MLSFVDDAYNDDPVWVIEFRYAVPVLSEAKDIIGLDDDDNLMTTNADVNAGDTIAMITTSPTTIEKRYVFINSDKLSNKYLSF